ncbi:MAG TPA: hypothetical protein VJH23_06435 [archaeon]|nr:hypothetical protein [archaeon]
MKITEGRILDKDFENQINSGIGEAQRQINSNISEAQKYVHKQQSMVEGAVSEHPFEFVLGAFVGGILLGSLLTKKG